MNLPVDTESIVFADEKNVILPDIDVESISFDDAKSDMSGGPNAMISAAPPKQSVWQRVKEAVNKPGDIGYNAFQLGKELISEKLQASPEESIAKAQNIYAISQNSGVPQQDIADHYEDLMKMSSVTGIESDPTKYEVLEKAMTLGLAPAMFAAPVPTAVGLLGFAALDAIFPTDDFIPEDASDSSRDNIRLIGMLVKGGIVGGFMHAAPKAPKDFPSGAQLVERPIESAARIRDNAIGIFKAFTRQKLADKGLPTEIIITPEQLTEIHAMQSAPPDAVLAAEAKQLRRNDQRRQRTVDELKDRILEGEKIDKGYHPEIIRDAKQEVLDHIAAIQEKEGKVRNRFQQIRHDLTKQLAEADKVTASMGLDSAKVETAINNGMSVKIPVESLVDVAVKSEADFVKVQEILSQKASKTAKETAAVTDEAGGRSGGSLPAETTPSAPAEGTGKTKTMGLAEGVEAKAIENKLTKGFEDLPEHGVLNMKEQATLVTAALRKDPQTARRVAMGEIPSPDPRITPEAFFVAVENKAIREGDAATLHALATDSKLVSEATGMGQRIRTLKERDPNSPTKVIREVSKAREEVAKKNLGKEPVEKVKQKIVKDIKKSIKEHTPTIDEWTSFLKELEC